MRPTNVAHFLDQGAAKPPLFIQTIFGILGGMVQDPENLAFIRRTASRLFGNASMLPCSIGGSDGMRQRA